LKEVEGGANDLKTVDVTNGSFIFEVTVTKKEIITVKAKKREDHEFSMTKFLV
jgi:hypothetical protein